MSRNSNTDSYLRGSVTRYREILIDRLRFEELRRALLGRSQAAAAINAGR